MDNKELLRRFRAAGWPGPTQVHALLGEAPPCSREERIRVKAEHVAAGEGGRACRTDLWLELEDNVRSLIIIVENKIDSGEHDNQLTSYEEALYERVREERLLNFDAKLVFLTPDGRVPDQEYDRLPFPPVSWGPLSTS